MWFVVCEVLVYGIDMDVMDISIGIQVLTRAVVF